MGRMLAVGVPVKIYFYKKRGIGEEDKYKIMQKEVSKYIDLNLYDTQKEEDGMILNLKKEVFDKNISDTLLEFYNIFGYCPNMYFGRNETDLELLKQKKYHIELNYNDDEYKEGVINYTLSKDEVYLLERQFPQEYWLIYDSGVNGNSDYCDYGLYIEYSNIWVEISKIDCENESNLLYFLNKMKVAMLKECNELTKTLMFFISG